MFNRTILDDDTWYVCVTWLGIGSIIAQHKATGRASIATRGEKSFFLDCMDELAHLGHNVPDSPYLKNIAAGFAEVISDRGSLHARAVFSLTPREIVSNTISELKGRSNGE